MTDEIQLVTVRTGAGVALEAASRNGENDGGEVVLYSGCQD